LSIHIFKISTGHQFYSMFNQLVRRLGFLIVLCILFSSLAYAIVYETGSPSVSQTIVRKWLSGWNKRVKITIDHNDVSSDLTDFPVLIYLGDASGKNNEDVTFVFDELASYGDRKKIAVTTSDNTTQCYVEIEKWGTSNQEAWLWVKVPSISSTADTNLYLYYDKNQDENTNYVGDTGSVPAQTVWDSSYKGVYHLQGDPETPASNKDSTSNQNNPTFNGAMTLGDQVAGEIDGSIDFDGGDDFVSVSNSGSLQFNTSLTIEAWINLTSFESGSDVNIILRKGEENPNDYQLAVVDQKLALVIAQNDGEGLNSSSTLSTMAWYYVVGTWDGTTRKLYIDGLENASDSKSGTIVPDDRAVYVGGRFGADFSSGIIDEVRASATSRNESWIKASYESGRDNLLDFGSEETA
jgi:hypothetical protein